MTLSLNSTAVGMNLTTSVSPVGGTGPFTWSILPGGAGGTISASGAYTSPFRTGMDTISAVDSLGATATAQILVGNAVELVCDILQSEMNLSSGQVYLWDQKTAKSNDAGLYLVVAVASCKPFGNTVKMDGSGSGLNAVQSTNFQATLDISAISRGPDARDRKEEILMALQSAYSQSQQELNSFYIGKISTSFVNLSELDGTAMNYRFNISVNIQYFVTKTKAVSYFGSFVPVKIATNS